MPDELFLKCKFGVNFAVQSKMANFTKRGGFFIFLFDFTY
jgi:hypothetical protein